MTQFLIFGRPRSRTAWVANFLTNGQSFCYHEGLASCRGKGLELQRRLYSKPGMAMGNSDTGMIHDSQALLKLFPDARLVVLTGSLLSWTLFHKKNRVARRLVDKVDRDYRATKELLRDRALFIDVNQLMTSPTVAGMLWQHCTGSPGQFSVDRWEMLRNLNVQVIPKSLARRLGIHTP